MRTVFRTNVDCAKPFMSRLNDEMKDAQPQVGDRVVIYETKDKVVEMKVVERSWRKSDWATTELVVELHLTHFWAQMGYDKFEAHLKG